jgi:hypothetical protein
MTRQEVQERMERFIALSNRETELKEELLDLELTGPDRKRIEKNLARHDEILREIEALRRDGMLPILNELAEFIAKKKAELQG